MSRSGFENGCDHRSVLGDYDTTEPPCDCDMVIWRAHKTADFFEWSIFNIDCECIEPWEVRCLRNIVLTAILGPDIGRYLANCNLYVARASRATVIRRPLHISRGVHEHLPVGSPLADPPDIESSLHKPCEACFNRGDTFADLTTWMVY